MERVKKIRILKLWTRVLDSIRRCYWYHRTVRYDWLRHYLFESIGEAQDYATDWMWTYNHERPNMALGGITPKQKLALLTPSTSDRC